MPRWGHLEVVLHAMGCLKLEHNSRLVFIPTYDEIDQSNFQECDWADFYEGAVEPVPPNPQSLRDKAVDLCVLDDSNHAIDEHTRRSRTRFMININMSLINWYFKKQSIIEMSVFNAALVAMILGVDTLHTIQ